MWWEWDARHSHGRTMRARRPRPSEKTTARVIPGFSPLGHPCRASPPAEGRAPHARKEGPGLTEARRHRPTASGPPILGNERPRHEHGLAMRTHGVHPFEKTTLRVMPVFSPLGHLPLDRPPRGGAGSARPRGTLRLNQGHGPIWPPGIRLPPMIMLCPGSHPASPRGRGDRVPCMYNTLAVG